MLIVAQYVHVACHRQLCVLLHSYGGEQQCKSRATISVEPADSQLTPVPTLFATCLDTDEGELSVICKQSSTDCVKPLPPRTMPILWT